MGLGRIGLPVWVFIVVCNVRDRFVTLRIQWTERAPWCTVSSTEV